MSVDESEYLRCRVRAAPSLIFFLVAQDRKLSLSGCLGWEEGALKRHVRNSSDDAAIEVASVFSVFLLVCSVFVIVGRSSRQTKLGLRPPCFFFRRHCRGTMFYGLWAWARLLLRSPFVEVRVLSPRSWSPRWPRITPDSTGSVDPP